MKYFFATLFVGFLISGCATRSAFSKFGITQEQELSIENTRSGEMRNGTKVGGIFSSVYLNNIYPNMSEDTNVFYISTYMRKDSVDNNESNDFSIKMNNAKPKEIRKLAYDTKLNDLLPVKTSWTNNYVVTFDNNETTDKIDLVIGIDQFSSGSLIYSKDAQ
jgi:hypothetical protein